MFDHVSGNNATIEYVNIIKEYVTINSDKFSSKFITMNNANNLNEGNILINGKSKLLDDIFLNNFYLECNDFTDIYLLDHNKMCCKRPIYKSSNGRYIIFWNSDDKTWYLTSEIYENEIGKNCHGGFMTNLNNLPYDNKWNIPCNITCIPSNVCNIIGIFTFLSTNDFDKLDNFIKMINNKFMSHYNKIYFIQTTYKNPIDRNNLFFEIVENNRNENLDKFNILNTLINLNKLNYIFNLPFNSFIHNSINDIDMNNDYITSNSNILIGSKSKLFIDLLKIGLDNNETYKITNYTDFYSSIKSLNNNSKIILI